METNSRQTFTKNCVGGVYHEGVEGGLTINRVAELQPYEDAVVAEEEAKAKTAENVTVVRKILHPGDALDSVRQTAEMIMKDAMEALQRTKQRLMEILPQSLNPSQKPSKLIEGGELQSLGESDVVTSAVLPPSLDNSKPGEKKERATEEKGSLHQSKL